VRFKNEQSCLCYGKHKPLDIVFEGTKERVEFREPIGIRRGCQRWLPEKYFI